MFDNLREDAASNPFYEEEESQNSNLPQAQNRFLPRQVQGVFWA